MFTITNLKYVNIYAKGLIFLPTHRSNFREFIKYEKGHLPDLALSSINLTENNVEINLQLNKDFFQLKNDILYDVFVKFVKHDERTRKNVYRIHKVMISDAIDNIDEQNTADDSDLLDNCEINEMFNKVSCDLDNKIKIRQDKLVMLLKRINDMEKNITNLNFIAEINNNFDKFLGKNYI